MNEQARLPPNYLKTQLCNYACRWSPADPTMLAVAQCQYFGLVGNGAVGIYSVTAEKGIQPIQAFQSKDATYDVCFNEANPRQVLSAHGDSTIKLWDLGNNLPAPQIGMGHQGEVNSVEWSHINKTSVLSGSMDKTIGLWDMGSKGLATGPVQKFMHNFTVYQAMWHPTHQSIFGSCSGDQTMKVWDLRSGKDVKSIHAHENEVLSMDFNKYENFVATSSADNMIKVWDLRATTDVPIMILQGHQLAVRKVKFSPYHANVLASASYDMSVQIWDCNTQRSINIFPHHQEFVTGIDFSLHQEGRLATASWDKAISTFRIDDSSKLLLQAAGMA